MRDEIIVETTGQIHAHPLRQRILNLLTKEMLGRVMSFSMLASVAFVPLSQNGSGVIATAWGTQTLFIAASTLTMGSAVGGLLVKSLRHLD